MVAIVGCLPRIELRQLLVSDFQITRPKTLGGRDRNLPPQLLYCTARLFLETYEWLEDTGLAGSSTDADDSDDGDAPQLPVNQTGSAQSQDWLMNDTEANGNHPKASGAEPTTPENRHAGTQPTLPVLAHDVANVSDGDDEEVIACTQQPPARESAMGEWIRVELRSPPARPTGVVNVQPECSETPRIDSSAAPDDYDSDVIPCSQQPPLSPVRRPGHPAIPASCIREAPRSVNIDSDGKYQTSNKHSTIKTLYDRYNCFSTESWEEY
ncbi:hypothetical protein QAD02_002806 [Eretmocerus hayati]|uniref:Uncharacterized protein n=1 Tax=Eretmocerus hayati TaxID=131215 RepID=A0ACC2NMT9_9HYME|nr:hypothetical protein QAD02_002806 [Eretmocerus hayati]